MPEFFPNYFWAVFSAVVGFGISVIYNRSKKDGEPLRRLDIFLNSNPVAVLLLGIVFTLLALIVPCRWQVVFLIFYLGFIWLMTLAWREGIDNVKGELFWSYKQFMSSESLRREIVNNVFLFIPLGVILTRLVGKAWIAVLISLAVSAAVETMQLAGNMGTFEFDDIISNGFGGAIGSMIAVTIRSHVYQVLIEMLRDVYEG